MIQTYIIAILSFITLLLSAIIIYQRKIQMQFSKEKNLLLDKLTEKENQYRTIEEEYNSMNNEIYSARDVEELRRDKMNELTGHITIKNRAITNNRISAVDFQKMFFGQNKLNNNIIPSCFVFDWAKEIVSGDFHWVEQVDSKVYMVLGDCSGHAIEGSFMTLLALSLLKESILNNVQLKNHSAGSSVHFIKNGFIKKVGQLKNLDNSFSHFRKIELSFCIIDRNKRTIQFSGAGNSIIHIKNNEIKEYKGNRISIGLNRKPDEDYKDYEISYQKNDCLYLYSDGYIHFDEKNKKFSKKQFKGFLKEISKLPMEEQKKEVEQKFDAKNLVDDFKLIGLKFE